MEEASSSSLALASLLDLFESELARVNFPDVSAALLRDAADSVEQQRLAVLAAEAALLSARDAYDQSRGHHERLGRRALAYARIYAEGDAELGTRLSGIAQGLSGTKPEVTAEAPRRRGRPRKSDVGLFGVDAGAMSSPAEQAEAGTTDDEDLFAESA